MSVYREGPAPANTCPRCREPLLQVPGVGGVRTCEKCGGVFADVSASRSVVSWLDRTLLEIAFQAALGKPRPRLDARPIHCPDCLVVMHKTRIEAAACTVDACPMHGTWFDAGELEAVLRAFARARRKGVTAPGARGIAAPTSHAPEIDDDDIQPPELASFLAAIHE